jgi:transposase
MKEFIAFDVHKHYTLATVERQDGRVLKEGKIVHCPGALSAFLQRHCKSGGKVAVETVGNWYWVVDEIEAAGFTPLLVNARKAKHRMDNGNKTDALDNRGINLLQRCGTLPTVWIPPAEVRDQRELPRTRMVLMRQRTQTKNRVLTTFSKHGRGADGVSDAFGKRGRALLEQQLGELPPHTQAVTRCLLSGLDGMNTHIAALEARMREVFVPLPEHGLLQSLPGVGWLLAVVIYTEVGTIRRFPRAANFASYAGVVPRVISSGGKTRYGTLRADVNRYLKWAFLEAANAVAMNARRKPGLHVSRLYQRIKHKRGYQKAVGAVARHLAEATYWILTKRQPYREPAVPTGKPARDAHES